MARPLRSEALGCSRCDLLPFTRSKAFHFSIICLSLVILSGLSGGWMAGGARREAKSSEYYGILRRPFVRNDSASEFEVASHKKHHPCQCLSLCKTRTCHGFIYPHQPSWKSPISDQNAKYSTNRGEALGNCRKKSKSHFDIFFSKIQSIIFFLT